MYSRFLCPTYHNTIYRSAVCRLSAIRCERDQARFSSGHLPKRQAACAPYSCVFVCTESTNGSREWVPSLGRLRERVYLATVREEAGVCSALQGTQNGLFRTVTEGGNGCCACLVLGGLYSQRCYLAGCSGYLGPRRVQLGGEVQCKYPHSTSA